MDAINFKIQQALLSNEMLFKSIETVTDPDEAVNYPVEFFNTLDLAGLPLLKLRLKIGSHIILLRINLISLFHQIYIVRLIHFI